MKGLDLLDDAALAFGAGMAQRVVGPFYQLFELAFDYVARIYQMRLFGNAGTAREMGSFLVDMLENNPTPSDAEIRRGLEGNLCRCTGYQNIVKSISAAAEAMGGGS